MGVIWRDTGDQGAMKILVHVGLHRAASTSLQNWFESNRNKLAGARQFLFSDLSSGKQGSLFGTLVGKTLIATGPRAAALLVNEELDRLAADYDGGVLSDENLLGLLLAPAAQLSPGGLRDVGLRSPPIHQLRFE